MKPGWRSFSHILWMFALAAASSAFAASDTALVTKKTNLRKDPSAQKPPIRVLLPDEELTILDSASAPRYLKVKTMDDKKTGWVWKSAVEILADTGTNPPTPPTTPTTPTTPTPSTTPEGAISPDWPKPDPVDQDFEGSEGTCGGTGDGGDSGTNARKNRSDPLPNPHDVKWSAINSLQYPMTAKPSRANWKPAELALIKPFEGVAVRTSGFLTHKVNVENSGSGESTNCHFHADDDVDWHIYLQENASDGMDKAVIVETTPRIRKQHHWDSNVLDKSVGTGNPIRVTGFLMVDPEHRNQVGKFRGTIWEIHPVTNIEVCKTTSCGDNDWVPLDQAK